MTWRKVVVDSAIERTPRGATKAMAREADASPRTVEAATRVNRWAADLVPAMAAGELAAVEASRIVTARLERADRWRLAVADAYAAEGKTEFAQRVRSEPIDRPARLARWLRSLVAAYGGPAMLARGATGAAVLGADPAETPESIPRS